MSHSTNECHCQCSELVSVLYEPHLGNIHRTVANLEAISSASATLLSEEKIEPGAAISFCAKGHDLYGTVETTELDPVLGWFITLKLDRSSRWHAQMFVPEHYLALCKPPFHNVTQDVTVYARLRPRP